MTVFAGDCIEGMRALPDDAVDVCITDPPYDDHTHGAQRQGCTGYVESKSGKPRRAEFNRARTVDFAPLTPELQRAAIEQVARVCRRWSLWFCSFEMIGGYRDAIEAVGLQYVRTMIWVKKNACPQFTGDRPAQGAEAIVLAHRKGKKRWNGGGKHGVFTHPIVINRSGKEPRLHRTQKPVELMQELVTLFSDEGEIVLDPFAGSGTTGVACLLLKRKFIGFELEADMAEKANRRIAVTELSVLGQEIQPEAASDG